MATLRRLAEAHQKGRGKATLHDRLAVLEAVVATEEEVTLQPQARPTPPPEEEQPRTAGRGRGKGTGKGRQQNNTQRQARLPEEPPDRAWNTLAEVEAAAEVALGVKTVQND